MKQLEISVSSKNESILNVVTDQIERLMLTQGFTVKHFKNGKPDDFVMDEKTNIALFREREPQSDAVN